MRTVFAFALVLGAVALPAPAGAHHSVAALYMTDQHVTMEGVVTRFQLGNPHMRIYFMRMAEDGTESEWMAEGGSRTVLLRRGWAEDDLKPGDRVVIHGNPTHTDSNIVHIENVTLPNGETRFGEDVDPSAIAGALARQRAAD